MPQYPPGFVPDPPAGFISDTDAVATAASKATSIQSDSWLRRALDTLPMVGGIAGSFAGARTTPVATALSAAGGAVGEGLRQGGYALSGRPTATSIPKQMAEAALEQGGSTLAGAGITKAAGAVAPWLMRKVLKPPLSERLAPRAEQTVRTALEEGINPGSVRSIGKIEPRIAGLNQQVEGMIGSTGTQQVASPIRVASRLARVARNYSGAGADPADRAAVRGVREQFLQDTRKPLTTMVPQQAQALGGQPYTQYVPRTSSPITPMTGPELLQARRSTGRSAGSTNFGITRGAETESRKELYGSLGTEIGNLYPETQPLLNRESRLIDLKHAAQAAYDRNANAPILSLRHAVPTAGGVATLGAGGNTQQALGVAAFLELLRRPRVGGRSAIWLHQLSQHPVGASTIPRAALAGWHALQDEEQ